MLKTGWSLYGDALFAMTIGDKLDIGIFPGYYGSNDPYSVQWSTDSSVAGGKPYIASPASSYISTASSMPSLAAGAVLHVGTMDVGLGLVSSYKMSTNSEYVAVDEDGDGYAETIVPTSDYYTTSSSWGAFGGPYMDVSSLNVDDTLVVSANLTFEWKLTDRLSLIGSGNATLKVERKVSYLRLSDSDLSGTQIDVQTPSAALFAGVSFRPIKEITLRAELGFTGTWLNQQNNSVGLSGSSVFSDGNSGHFHEVSWPSQPNNGAVRAAVSTSTDSYSSSNMTCEVLFGLDWAPAPSVVMFGVGSFGFATSSTLYSVYNATTAAVWQETAGGSNLALMYSLNIGTGVFVTSNIFVGVSAGTGTSGRWNASSDGLPISNGVASTGGSGTYSEQYNYQYSGGGQITFFCVLTL